MDIKTIVDDVSTLEYGSEDLLFPSSGINLPGAPADPTRSQTTGLLEFSGSADNVVAGAFQMPHGWLEGSSVEPHLHLIMPTTSTNTSRWKLEINKANIGGLFDNAYGSYTTVDTISVTNPNSARKHVYASFGAIDMTGNTFSSIVMWRLSRLANSDGSDNDTSAIVLVDFDVHYWHYRLGHNFTP